MKKWRIQTKSIVDLVPHPKNPRQFTEKGMKDLGRSIDAFGLAEPIVVNSDDTIIGGHARVKVLQMKGETECDCYVPDRQLSEKEVEQLMIRLNANQAGVWNTERLANEWDLSELMDWGLDLPDFVINGEAVEDDYVIPDEIITSIQTGDLFELTDGNLTHKILCGDSTKAEDVARLMDGEKADMIFTDPPYGVGYEYNDYIDTKNRKDYEEFVIKYVDIISALSNVLIITCGKWNAYIYYKNFKVVDSAVWHKKFGNTRGSWYKAMTTEPVLFLGKKPKNKFLPQDYLEYPTDRFDGLREKHPCPKPIKFVANLIATFSNRKDIILDVFGGSGTTLIACEQLNRNCYMMEIDERYCQVIIDRMKKSFPDIEIKQIN